MSYCQYSNKLTLTVREAMQNNLLNISEQRKSDYEHQQTLQIEIYMITRHHCESQRVVCYFSKTPELK